MTFVPNPLFIPELERSLAMRAAERASAELVREQAERFGKQAQMPWLPRKGAKATFVVAQQGRETAVVCTDHAGHLAEWGGANNPPHAPLRRAVRAAGLHLK